jgi:hypothetical protein
MGAAYGPSVQAMIDKFQKRLSKKARRGFRGWPMATIAFYGPDLARASKITASIVQAQGAEPEVMQSWHSDAADLRYDGEIAAEILSFIEDHGAKSVAMIERIIGCPHEQGIDYHDEWCPVCSFWKGRDRFMGKLLPSV